MKDEAVVFKKTKSGYAVKLGSEINDSETQGKEAQMDNTLKYWKDLACANRKVAEEAQAQRDKAVEMLRFMREEYANLPHSLGYSFTHLPKIDDFLKECGK